MSTSWRLFIAIDLPAPVIDLLRETQDMLKKRTPSHTVRWVASESTHLTLKFLGDVPLTQREAIQQALERAAHNHAPFELATAQSGYFPAARPPRVVWVGLQRNLKALNALRDAVETHVAPLGYPTEQRSFHPHLTLGRIQNDANQAAVQQLKTLLDNTTLAHFEQWTISQITLFRSELTPRGAIYTPLFHAPLTPRSE